MFILSQNTSGFRAATFPPLYENVSARLSLAALRFSGVLVIVVGSSGLPADVEFLNSLRLRAMLYRSINLLTVTYLVTPCSRFLLLVQVADYRLHGAPQLNLRRLFSDLALLTHFRNFNYLAAHYLLVRLSCFFSRDRYFLCWPLR